MNYTAIKVEIETGPLAAECAGQSDTSIAAILNEQRFTASRLVPLAEIQPYLMAENVWWDIVDAASDSSQPDRQYIARRAADYFNSPRVHNIDLSLPLVQQMVGGMVTTGLITQTQLDTIVAMGQQPASRGEIIGLGTITPGDVSRAMRGPW